MFSPHKAQCFVLITSILMYSPCAALGGPKKIWGARKSKARRTTEVNSTLSTQALSTQVKEHAAKRALEKKAQQAIEKQAQQALEKLSAPAKPKKDKK